ncbi:MAG: penicillin-binding protein 2 [Patescibacteria group bacterium]
MAHIALKNKSDQLANSARITVLIVLFLLLGFLIIFRLFILQIVKYSLFKEIAEGQHQILTELIPERGKIYVSDKDGGLFAIAENEALYLLFAVPPEIENASTTVKKLSDVMGWGEEDQEKALEQLGKINDPYEPLAHYLSEQQKNQILSLGISGLYFHTEGNRVYREGNSFAQLTGFLGYKGDERVGQYGLEEYFEQELEGEYGFLKSEKDPAGRLIGVGDFDIEQAKNGANVYLTVDRLIQFKVCDILKKSIEKYGASGGTIIVEKTNTGELLAMCSEPSFDPNNYSKVESPDLYLNPAVSFVYEPGSIFKAIIMAAALDTNSVSPETTYEDKGILIFGKDKIKNAGDGVYGISNMVEVLEKSINTGAVFAAEETGRLNIKKYLENFGFGSKLGVDLPGEVAGDISALDKRSEIYLATASFGQGISVTPLQMVASFSAIANGGILLRPFIVKKIITDGTENVIGNQEIRRVISQSTANTLKAMLVSVVKNGHGVMAQVDGYNVGGKTGTAQIPGSGGGYINAFNHSFVGFAPVINTKFTVFVLLRKPTRGAFSASTATAAFAEVMSFLLNYYQVPPS